MRVREAGPQISVSAPPAAVNKRLLQHNLPKADIRFWSEMKETANEGGPHFSKLRMTSNALLVRKLVGENVNPVNFRRFGKEVARLGFFHQSRRHFAI
jgi:hypothetical protein